MPLVLKLNSVSDPSPAEFLALIYNVYKVLGKRTMRSSERVVFCVANFISGLLAKVTV